MRANNAGCVKIAKVIQERNELSKIIANDSKSGGEGRRCRDRIHRPDPDTREVDSPAQNGHYSFG
jgi:hypothetical protein